MPLAVTRGNANPVAYVVGFHRALYLAGGIAFLGAITSWVLIRDSVAPKTECNDL
jgi:hypothetical protein